MRCLRGCWSLGRLEGELMEDHVKVVEAVMMVVKESTQMVLVIGVLLLK